MTASLRQEIDTITCIVPDNIDTRNEIVNLCERSNYELKKNFDN